MPSPFWLAIFVAVCLVWAAAPSSVQLLGEQCSISHHLKAPLAWKRHLFIYPSEDLFCFRCC